MYLKYMSVPKPIIMIVIDFMLIVLIKLADIYAIVKMDSMVMGFLVLVGKVFT